MVGELAERIRWEEELENERAQWWLDGRTGAVTEMGLVTEEMCNGKDGRAVGLQVRPLYHNHGRATEDLVGIKE
jgi:hypothetical protein